MHRVVNLLIQLISDFAKHIPVEIPATRTIGQFQVFLGNHPLVYTKRLCHTAGREIQGQTT